MMRLSFLLILSGFWALTPQALAEPQTPASPVKVAQVKQTDLAPTARLLGTVYSRNNVMVTAGVDGQLTWIVEPGTLVSKGDTLVTMDTFPLELAQLEQQAQIKRAEINLRYLKRELERLVTLQAHNNAAEYQLDENRSKYELANADLEIARLKLKQINDQLDRAQIEAPFDGVITERLVREGTDVNRSDTLLRMMDTEHLEVHLHVPVKYLSKISRGKPLTISSEHYLTQATIRSVIPAADPRSQTFELRMTLPAESVQYLTAGELVKVAIPVQQPRQTLAVHRDALILRRQGSYVMKIDDDNVAHKTQVVVGDGQGDWVAIEGELAAGDRVAIRGAERLREGQKVSIQGASAG
ncbi:efflux RND transporter periplasmic adaptor subunit [Ferrimonas kyonanensis]|uniref:efflux RND transporter periplasmic adaptor subunit n=1 Tax=Ferrimonas kyonanensis TaxID=364763 RepID=UPI0004249CE8|nr:efflux RND transporter periplasmic adaptor subunit [Ferrimonas kyonanensis]